MAKKKTYSPQTTPSTVNEPIAAYEISRISFFNSLEEQEKNNYTWLASLTPKQHLQYATQLIKRIFARELKKNPTVGNRIKFD